MARLRTRGHKVVLSRSVGGDTGITIMLVILGAFMFIPLFYSIMQSLKPLDELFQYPPRFIVIKPTLDNYGDLVRQMSGSWVPFSRYIFNTVLVSVIGTGGNLLLGSMAAYAMAKIKFPGGGLCFKLVRTSLMFHSTVSALTSFVILSVTHMIDTYWALILPAFATSLGLYLMKQHMDGSIAPAVLESARLDGAHEFRIYLTIAMPMVKPACLTLIIQTFQSLWNSGSSVYIYSEQLKSFNYALQQLSTSGVRYAGVQAAGTVIMMAVPILVFVISQSNIMETMASSGMKD